MTGRADVDLRVGLDVTERDVQVGPVELVARRRLPAAAVDAVLDVVYLRDLLIEGEGRVRIGDRGRERVRDVERLGPR
ncbi:hypothetical protein DJ84_09115, partial [Halorubrum ezzemoulense]